jgi:hypothetical protein
VLYGLESDVASVVACGTLFCQLSPALWLAPSPVPLQAASVVLGLVASQAPFQGPPLVASPPPSQELWLVVFQAPWLVVSFVEQPLACAVA